MRAMHVFSVQFSLDRTVKSLSGLHCIAILGENSRRFHQYVSLDSFRITTDPIVARVSDGFSESSMRSVEIVHAMMAERHRDMRVLSVRNVSFALMWFIITTLVRTRNVSVRRRTRRRRSATCQAIPSRTRRRSRTRARGARQSPGRRRTRRSSRPRT